MLHESKVRKDALAQNKKECLIVIEKVYLSERIEVNKPQSPLHLTNPISRVYSNPMLLFYVVREERVPAWNIYKHWL